MGKGIKALVEVIFADTMLEVDALEKRMHQKSTRHHPFRIRWRLI